MAKIKVNPPPTVLKWQTIFKGEGFSGGPVQDPKPRKKASADKSKKAENSTTFKWPNIAVLPKV